MGEHVQKARKLQLFFMEAITYQKKKKKSCRICKYCFASISSLTSFVINNRMDLITESF